MGLDMFLNRRVYIGANYESNKISGIIELKSHDVPINIDLKKVTYIYEQVMYWRKAGAIHNWFVEHIQDGKDDCKEYYVDPDDLNAFIELCKNTIKQIKAGVSDDKLELPSGYEDVFDDYYVNELLRTVNTIEPLLLKGGGDFYYKSSW